MRVATVNLAYDAAFGDPDALLLRYDTLVGWAESLLEQGASGVSVTQRFHRDCLPTALEGN